MYNKNVPTYTLEKYKLNLLISVTYVANINQSNKFSLKGSKSFIEYFENNG